MKKLWNTLVVLGILLCMLMSLGVSAEAAEGDYAVLAVNGELSLDQMTQLRSQYSGSILLAVAGSTDAQTHMGYDVVNVPADPVTASDVTYIWPGEAKRFTAMSDYPVVLVGVGADTAVEELASAIANCGAGDTDKVVAVADAGAAAKVDEYNATEAAVKIQMVLIPSGDGADSAAASVAVKAAVVGSDPGAPITQVLVNVDGAPEASAIAAPVVATPEPTAEPTPEPEVTEEPEPEATEEPQVDLDPAMGMIGDPQIFDDPNEVQSDPSADNGPEVQGDDGAESAPVWVPGGDGGLGGLGNLTFVTLTFKSDAEAEGNPQRCVANTTFYLNSDLVDAREGFVLTGWQEEGTETTHEVGEEYMPTEDKTFVAQWEALDTMSEPGPVTSYTVTYLPGDVMTETVMENDVVTDPTYTLKACEYQAEGKVFAGWSVPGLEGVKQGGESITLTGDITITATWTDAVQPVTHTVTYSAGDGSGDAVEAQTAATNEDTPVGYTLIAPPEQFTAPEGETFDGWDVNGETFEAGATIQVNSDINAIALWKSISKTPGEPGGPVENLTYIKGGTDPLKIAPFKTAVEKVQMDGADLTKNTQYGTYDDSENKIVFPVAYLDGLSEGGHTVKFFLKDTEDTDYPDVEKTLTISAASKAAEDPDDPPQTSAKMNWPRDYDLEYSFSGIGTPTKVEFYYFLKDANGNYTNTPGYIELTNGTDYTIDGSSLILKRSLINAGWKDGQALTFRVHLNKEDGTESLFTLTATVAGQPTSATPTPTPTVVPQGTSPVTGDTNNVTLYVIILVILIIALAVVLIVVIKRRNR